MEKLRLADVDLNLLYTLQVFVEAGSVAGAGRVLGRSQPAISARLHQLEKDLGVALFERQGRRLVLTPLGRSISTRAGDLLHHARGILDHARTGAAKPSGHVRIGALTTVGVHVLAPLLARFLGENPDVTAQLTYDLGAAQVRALLAGALDLVVSVGAPPEQRTLRVIELAQVRPVAVVPKSRARHLPDPCCFDDVAGLPLYTYGRLGDAFFDAVSQFVDEQAPKLRARLQVAHIRTLKVLVSAGRGLAVLPDYTVVERDLVSRHLAGLSFSQPLWLATRASAEGIPVIDALVQALMRRSLGVRSSADRARPRR